MTAEEKNAEADRKVNGQGESAGGAPSADSVSSEELKKALKAFKKRLKLSRLEDESRLGGRATTSGAKSSIVAIVPPSQYRQAVWDELVKRGRLKYSEHGLYELVRV